MKERAWSRAAPLLLVALLGAAIWLLDRELRAYRYDEIRAAVVAIPRSRIAWALLLSAASYWILTGYDVLALRHLGHAQPYRRTALASFIGYVFSHNLGLSVLGGAAVRYQLYSGWQLSAAEIAILVGFTSVTFWVGSLTVSGLALLFDAHAAAASLHVSVGLAHVIGAACVLAVALYVLATVARRAPLFVRGWDLSLPRTAIALQQVVLAAVDWAVTAAVLYVLLPSPVGISFPHFVGLFVIAQVIGVTSQVPGGLGVFETGMLLALSPHIPGPQVLGSLLVFRAVYYLLPLAVGTAMLVAHEGLRRRQRLAWFPALFGRLVPIVAPRLLAVAAFVCGAILLFSGATPAAHDRLSLLGGVVPLPVLEASHFLASLVGVGLLLLASGLQRRLDAAYHLALVLLAAGVVFALLRGLHFEEAVVFAIMLAALVPCRQHFYRRTSIVSERFTTGWTIAVVLTIGASIWLGFFAYRHREYSHELWWQFSLTGGAPRFLRASVGAVVAALFFAVAHLMRPAPVKASVPDRDSLAAARAVVAQAPTAAAHLALLGDKSFLFSDDRRAFIMYAVAGRSCVAMGDPVGPPECHAELVWRFSELCDQSDSWPVFYEASAASLPLYLDLGLSPLKFGDEARVELAEFSLEGSAHKQQRYVVRRIERDGGRFEVLPATAVAALLPRLEDISNDWLAEKRTREKAFSLGRFDPEYLVQFPLAVVRQGDEVVAFANLWCSGESEEVSPDLMRYHREAPQNVMEYLFLQVMLWAQREGYRWCNLGMAPLSGLESHSLAPLWHRLGAFAFRYGEQLYNFQGVRQFKAKFDPVWRAKYLVSPGGIALPRILTNVAGLVSGGLKGVVGK